MADTGGGGSVLDPRDARIAELEREIKILRMAHAELERVAMRDDLVPLYNRRYFDTVIARQAARVDRYGASAAMIYVDIDNMKAINDGHGHAAGDYALIHVAGLLKRHIRQSDIAARIGGDEFAVLLESISAEEAEEKRELLRHAIADSACDFDGAVLRVSASLGLAMLQPGEALSDLLERADAAMYSDKRGHCSRRGGMMAS